MSEMVLIKGDLLWNGKDKNLIKGGSLLVKNGRIVAVGPFDGVIHSEYNATIDFLEFTIIPGLIDMHTHLSMDATLENYLDHMRDPVAELTLRATAMMRKDLHAGVTTCRCMGDRDLLDIACRKAVNDGLVEGPHLLVAAKGIRAPHGHGFVGYPFQGKEAIKNAILENKEAGADLIKIYITGTLKGNGDLPSFLTKDEIRTAIDESHKAGLPIAAHCVGGIGLDWAIELGLNTIEHAYHITDQQIEKLQKSGTQLVLTPSPMLLDERIHHLPASLIQGHLNEKEEIARCMSALIKSGMPYAVGTDGLHAGLGRELQYCVAMGAKPFDALQAATIHGANICGLGDETGSLEPGKRADLLIIKGNPLKDVDAITNVIAVFKEGKLVYQQSQNK